MSLEQQQIEKTILNPQEAARLRTKKKSRRGFLAHGGTRKQQTAQTAITKVNYTLREYNSFDYRIITALSGQGQIEIAGQVRSFQRGDSVPIAPGQTQKLINPSTAPLIAEIRPQNPRYWHPDKSFIELSQGNFVPGKDVWFELVLPL